MASQHMVLGKPIPYIGTPTAEMISFSKQRFNDWDANGQPGGDVCLQNLLRLFNQIPDVSPRWSCGSHGDDPSQLVPILPVDKRHKKKRDRNFYIMFVTNSFGHLLLQQLFRSIVDSVNETTQGNTDFASTTLTMTPRVWNHTGDNNLIYDAVNLSLVVRPGTRSAIIAGLEKTVEDFLKKLSEEPDHV